MIHLTYFSFVVELFDGIDKIIGKEETHNSIGFGANVSDKKESVADLSKIEQHVLVKYGLMPELIGRLPNYNST